jgi:hypothetical protein
MTIGSQPATPKSSGDGRRWSPQEVDDWVVPQIPSDVVLLLFEAERDHFLAFNNKYGRFVTQTEVHFSLLVRAIEKVDYTEKETWPIHRGAQFVLATNTLRSLWSSADRLHKGAYQDSMTLLRTAYEVWGRLVFMSCHSEGHLAVVAPYPSPGQPSFNMTNFLRDSLLGLVEEVRVVVCFRSRKARYFSGSSRQCPESRPV